MRAGLAVQFLALSLGSLSLASCGDSDSEAPAPFALKFAATVDGKEVGCTDNPTGFGPGGAFKVGLSDLRFYISNVRFLDKDGNVVPHTLDTNDFQYNSADGSVALVDLTGNSEGSCAPSSIAFAEGTARTNRAVTGTTLVGQVASVAFDVGIPQPLMKKIIATNTPEGSPSPMSEMYWSWNSGYRHFVFNFAVDDGAGHTGSGYVHVGSRDCAPMSGKALEDRASCTFVNTPAVTLPAFDLTKQSVGLDLRKLLADLTFQAPIYDTTTFAVIGQGPGVECHSDPSAPACGPVFSKLGVDITTGVASAANNVEFYKRD